MLAKPLVATSRKRLRGAAASPPEKTFSRGHKALSTEFDAEEGFAMSSSAPARGTIARDRAGPRAREARRGAGRARGSAGVTPSATAVVMVRRAERL
jgi:hypothetical protein